MEKNRADENYYKLRKVMSETSPLPKEELDIPTRAINPDLYDYTEDKAQIELEVEIEKRGVPIIDVERPPVPNIKTDTTPYKKVTVTRKAKKSDNEIKETCGATLREDREMKAYVEELRIPKKKSILSRIKKKLYEFYCKICRTILNINRKRVKIKEHKLPEGVKKISLESVTDEDLKSMGMKRGFQRDQDETSSFVNMVRNKKNGSVVATPSVSAYVKSLKDRGKSLDDYEVVESQIKDAEVVESQIKDAEEVDMGVRRIMKKSSIREAKKYYESQKKDKR